jgi:hypothetical protein
VSHLSQCLCQVIACNFIIFNDQNMHEGYFTDVGPLLVGTISLRPRELLIPHKIVIGDPALTPSLPDKFPIGRLC